jgi:hypothetical protein
MVSTSSRSNFSREKGGGSHPEEVLIRPSATNRRSASSVYPTRSEASAYVIHLLSVTPYPTAMSRGSGGHLPHEVK